MNSSEKKAHGKSGAQIPGNGTKVQGTVRATTSHTTLPGGKEKGKAGSKPHQFQSERQPKTSNTMYMLVFGACVLLVGSYAIYVSSATKKPWTPVPEGGDSFEPKSVPVVQLPPPPREQPVADAEVTSPPSDNAKDLFHPNAIIDVPKVGLRNIPDISWKATFGDLKRGERVEIVKKVSGKGPTWIKVRTKSGKVGWIVASLVKERKG